MMKKVLIFFCGIFFLFYSHAQDSIFARKIIRDLSSPAMFGRGYTYSGDSLAAEYIVNVFKQNGIKPLTNNYFQQHGFYAFSMEDNVQFIIGNYLLSPFDDYRIAPYSASFNEKMTLLKIDLQIFNDKEKRDKIFEKYDFENRLVYIDISAKKWQKPDNKEELKKFLNELQRKTTFYGIAAVLIGVNELPVWTLSGTDFERDFAVIYVRSSLIKGKEKEVFSISFDNVFNYHQTQNIAAMVKGTHYPDSFYVFTAHYDHLGTMGDSVIFFGAHDNASGVAMTLDLARFVKKNPLPYSTIFYLLSGEETGLKGSIYASLHPLFDFKKVKLLINLDMQCGGDEGIMIVNSQADNTKEFYKKMQKINSEMRLVAEVKSRPNAPNSDHYPFSFYMPAIFIYTLGGKIGKYHHFNDTCDRCSLEHYSSIFTLIIKTLNDN